MAGIGRAVWCVGDRHHQVQTVLHPAERALADTNQTLRNQVRATVTRWLWLVAPLLVVTLLVPLDRRRGRHRPHRRRS